MPAAEPGPAQRAGQGLRHGTVVKKEFRTGGSGTEVSALATGSMACSTPPAPLPTITRPA